MFGKILLAVDDSEHGLHAAKVAGDLARSVDAEELRLVVAYDPVPAYLGEPNLSRVINKRMEHSNAILAEAKKAVGTVPAETATELIEGSPAEAIVNAASSYGSDVIVMGSRGRGRLTGALLGSNSQKVVSHASCPVLIVR